METDYAVKRGEFSWALEQVKRGKKVYRPSWLNCVLGLSMGSPSSHDYIALFFPKAGLSTPYIPTHADLLADDWELFDD